MRIPSRNSVDKATLTGCSDKVAFSEQLQKALADTEAISGRAAWYGKKGNDNQPCGSGPVPDGCGGAPSAVEFNGEPIRSAPDVDSPQILASEEGDQQAYLLACWGDFMKIRVKGGAGWTKALCLNQRTTCV